MLTKKKINLVFLFLTGDTKAGNIRILWKQMWKESKGGVTITSPVMRLMCFSSALPTKCQSKQKKSNSRKVGELKIKDYFIRSFLSLSSITQFEMYIGYLSTV